MNLSKLVNDIGFLTEKETYQKVLVETPDGTTMQVVSFMKKMDGTWVLTTKYHDMDLGFLEDDEEDVETTRPSGEFMIVQPTPPSIPIDEDMAHVILGGLRTSQMFKKVDDDAKARLVRVLRAVHPGVVKQYEGVIDGV